MRHTTLIVPGFRGSGELHWQTWFESELPQARRVGGIDWEAPVISEWSAIIGQAIDEASSPVWLVAHSFGCLATALAVQGRSDKVAGALLVAPADPWRFAPTGLVEHLPLDRRHESVYELLPSKPFDFPSIVVASVDDPWVKFTAAAYWADVWGSRLVNAGYAGHINVDSGYGPWPYGLQLLQDLQSSHSDVLLGDFSSSQMCHINRTLQGVPNTLQAAQDGAWHQALKACRR